MALIVFQYCFLTKFVKWLNASLLLYWLFDSPLATPLPPALSVLFSFAAPPPEGKTIEIRLTVNEQLSIDCPKQQFALVSHLLSSEAAHLAL